mgnify:CR=1 FL=1
MKVTIVCSDPRHPVYPHLQRWSARNSAHEVSLISSIREATGGDLMFLISCNELVKKEVRDRFAKTLVIHASDLPRGRGWSPHIWQILEGNSEIVVTLLEAEDKVDSGNIWHQIKMQIEPGDLVDEIHEKLFQTEVELMDFAVQNFATIQPRPQRDEPPTFYPKRQPEDSRLDPDGTIADQFNLIRVCDPDRYPAFFDLHGHRYEIRLTKKDIPGE